MRPSTLFWHFFVICYVHISIRACWAFIGKLGCLQWLIVNTCTPDLELDYVSAMKAECLSRNLHLSITPMIK